MRRPGRTLTLERLEPRQLLALTHLYTFNDGLANDWIGNAHGTLFNGATVTAGQLVLANAGVTSGQTGVIQHMRLPAGVLPSVGSFTVEVWFTATDAAAWARVFDVGDQSAGLGNSYVFFTPQSGFDDSRGVVRAAGADERIASGVTTDDGVQHMAAIVVDAAANTLRLAIDGVEVSATPLDGVHAGSINDALAYLGRSLFNADPGLTGSINELRIYDEARSAADVNLDASAGPSTAAKSPLVRQLEYLDRGVVAIRRSSSQMYVSWRLLATDPADVAFNVYRIAGQGAPVKLNATPIITTTDFVDSSANFSVANTYFVRPVLNGVELAASESWTVLANTAVGYFLEVPLQVPSGGTTPSGENYTYSANDASVGDVDGDGQYEIILKWDPSNSKDNSQSGYTGNVYLDAYKLDGTRLWRIDLGRNVRAGAHYTPFLVYDFDGDGRAEVVARTAEATVDGVGTVIGNPNADYRNSSGYILSGPETMTIFNGLTGAIIHSIPLQPTRGSVSSWGDNYGNRVDRFQLTVAYLDGVHPSFVLGRGYAGPQSGFSARNEVAAYDFRNGELSVRWVFQAATNGQNPGYVGQSAHSITVGDVDNDGKDEIITGASALDDNGALLYNTGLGHGDALHMTDMDPSRPGLEVFMPHEGTGGNGHIGASLRDARTGALMAAPTVVQNSEGDWPDVGRGVAADIDPTSPGYEFWDSYHGSVYDAQGNVLYAKPGNMHVNHLIWWDADLERETLDGTTISNWNYTTHGRANIDLNPNQSGTQSAPGVSSNNGSKSNPSLTADIFGDWREEAIWRTSNSTALRIFTTPVSANNRLDTLMHDSQYRQAIAWQNSGYNQPPHPSFFLGAGMAAPPTPQIYVVLNGDYNGDLVVDALDLSQWSANFGQSSGANHDDGDSDGDSDVDGADFLAWQRQLGTSAAPPAAAATLTSGDRSLAVFASSSQADANAAADLALRDAVFTRLAGAFASPNVPRAIASRPSDRPAPVVPSPAMVDNTKDPTGIAASSSRSAPIDGDEASDSPLELALQAVLLDEQL